MDRFTVYKTDKGRYAVRPIDWAGIWDNDWNIKENGINHTAIFEEKEDAEFFARTKSAEEQGKMMILPCKPGDTVYFLENVNYTKKIGVNEVVTARVIGICSSSNEEGEKIWCMRLFMLHGEYLIPFDKFGKIVFSTKQEAEKALEGMENEYR